MSDNKTRDAWFLVALVLVAILSLYAPKFAGILVILVAVYVGSVPLQSKIFNRA